MGVNNFNIMSLNKARLIEPEKVGYEDSIDIIREELQKTRKSFIKIGWYLKHIHDNKFYEQGAYANIYDFAMEKFRFSQPTTTRYIKLCEEFSVNHNSPELDQKYEDYNISQLFEMLSMKQDQIEQVTPEMTVTEIRELKRPSKSAVQKFYDMFVKDTEFATSREGLKQFLIDELGKSCTGGSHGGLNYICSRKGIKLNGSSEITWASLVKEINELIPIQEENVNNIIPGQTSIEKDFPQYMPDDNLINEINEVQEVPCIKEKEETIIDGEYREVKEPENIATSQSEKLSPYGLPKTVCPEGSCLTTVGCGHKYDCFSCAKECNIRQDKRYCVEAPLGNPFECTTMNVFPNLRHDFPEQCQFINEDLAFHRAGDNQPSPCCKKCSVAECGYRCMRASNVQAPEKFPVETDELSRVRNILEEKKHDLEEWMKVAKVEEIPEPVIFEKKTIVGALASMVYELEKVKEKPDPAPQPELPVLKNNDQRKEWLGNYKAWGLWYRDENIDVNYYKYDFEDGSRLIISEYPDRHCYWNDELKDETFYHLLEKNKKSYKKKYDEVFRHSADSETYLVDFLKNLQKERK